MMDKLDKPKLSHSDITIALFLIIVVMQWAHFAWYFDQPILRSFIWSFVDWGVWFSLFFVSYQQLTKLTECSDSKKFGIGVVSFILLAGPIQITVSSAIYQILFTADKTLFESFLHLMNKRWLQNLMIAMCGLLLIRQFWLTTAKSKETSTDKHCDKLTVTDGEKIYRLNTYDINALCSSKNYLSIFTNEGEIVIRSTLKEIKAQLPAQTFIQVSRSAIINKNAVAQLEKYSSASFHVVLSNQFTVNVSKSYLPEVRRYFSH